MSSSAIVVENLSKQFHNTLAVDNLSFTAEAGKTIALLGGNGAGKSTTIAMLLGLLIPTSGKISVLGIDMLRNRHAALSQINFSSPYVDLPHRLKVIENLRVYAGLYGIKKPLRRIEEVAEALELTSFLPKKTGSLSSGQKTRVALAKALLNEPKVLLLDEPTASLDPDTGDRIRTHLEAYQQQTGATILLASHNMLEVERMSHYVLMMRRGKLVDEGSCADLISRHGRHTLEEVFLAIARAPDEDAAAA